MRNFVKYAKYYDSFYRDKGYKREVDYVDSLIKFYSNRRNKTLLDIGCGTGNHDFWFAKKGYRVIGVDKSKEMLDLAREKMQAQGGNVEFYQRDISGFSLDMKFDVVVALFHVMSYLTDNGSFIRSLQNIHNHLRMGGLFIFDFWYGPAVLVQKPGRNVKNSIDEGNGIKRTASPEINFNTNTVKVAYKITVSDKNNGPSKIIKESHKMRYFFLPELDFMLGRAGFKIAKTLKWLSNKESLSPKSWSGLIVAKRG